VEAEPGSLCGDAAAGGMDDLRVSVAARGRRLEMRVHGALDSRASRQLAEIVAAAVRVAQAPQLVELDVRPVSVCCREGADALVAWEREGIRVRRAREPTP
jgi:hypothetical protein